MSQKKLSETAGNTATYLLTKQTNLLPDVHRVKVAIIGSGNVGTAAAISTLFKFVPLKTHVPIGSGASDLSRSAQQEKRRIENTLKVDQAKYEWQNHGPEGPGRRLTSELVLIDTRENLARAEAEDISHAGAFLGNPKIVGTKDYSAARDAAVCVITAGGRQYDHQEPAEILRTNLDIFRSVIPNVCKFAPNSILIVVTSPVDILSYVAMKLSGFPPHRVIGLGTFLNTCRLQCFIAEKLGISANSVQALVIGENNSTSVPVWSAVSVMGIRLKDINKEIGSKVDPEGWGELHNKVVTADEELMKKKGCGKWGIGICIAEIIDTIVRNTRTCMTVSTFVRGCKHGLEKDIFMSLPCIVGRNGVLSYVRCLYTQEEQELIAKSCQSISDAQKPILDKLE